MCFGKNKIEMFINVENIYILWQQLKLNIMTRK